MDDQGILDVIRVLSSNEESGRLQLTSGTMEGEVYFQHGKLVDARMGELTGFRAINAAAALRNGIFTFDPSVPPPAVSSITPNERTVLKQFFGIETVDPHEYSYEEELIGDEVDEEVTLVRSSESAHEAPPPSAPSFQPLPVEPAPIEAPMSVEPMFVEPPSLEPTSEESMPVEPVSVESMPFESTPVQPMQVQPIPRTPFYRHGLFLAALAILVAVGFVALLYRFRDRSVPPLSETTTVQSPAPSQPVVEQVNPESSAQDLTGKWNVVNTVESTSYSAYKNMQIGFQVSINQNGNGFTGTGQKVSENGRSLPADSRTPINVKGSIDGDRVEATFSEEGQARRTNGRFVWRIDKAGGLTGTFSSSAARASGKSTAKKEF
jgi:hypothetical protein